MNENIEKTQRRADALFQQSPYPAMLWSTGLKVVDTNNALLAMTGYDRDRVLAMTLQDFNVISASGEGFEEAKRLKRNVIGEATFNFPKGKIIVIRHTIPLLDPAGELENILTIYRDVTQERHDLEVIQNSELRSKKIYTYLEKEIDGLAVACGKVADGDLTVHHEITLPDNDTQTVYANLKKLHEAVRGIIRNLRVNIGDVDKKMQNLTSTAENATRSIEEGSKGVQQIAKNAGNVSSNAEKASLGVDQIAQAMQDMSAAVEEITSSMESVSILSKQANELSQSGAALAVEAEKGMADIATHSGKVRETVLDVVNQMEEISKIVTLIRELANQTNLLALNAAIEAARAGDAGRGFAVVATEVKSLAQESRNSAERIEDMISSLKKISDNASIAMKDAQEKVDRGSEIVTGTLQSFNKIAAAVEKVAASATEVAAATEEQAATTQEITASVSEVARLVEQTAKEASDAAAATEESSAALDEISRMVATVDTIAVEAMEANKKFKVD
jgi:methyl-accepting chemotaxis protein